MVSCDTAMTTLTLGLAPKFCLCKRRCHCLQNVKQYQGREMTTPLSVSGSVSTVTGVLAKQQPQYLTQQRSHVLTQPCQYTQQPKSRHTSLITVLHTAGMQFPEAASKREHIKWEPGGSGGSRSPACAAHHVRALCEAPVPIRAKGCFAFPTEL